MIAPGLLAVIREARLQYENGNAQDQEAATARAATTWLADHIDALAERQDDSVSGGFIAEAYRDAAREIRATASP